MTPEEAIEWLRKEAKEGREAFAEDAVPVTRDCYITKYEEVVKAIEKLASSLDGICVSKTKLDDHGRPHDYTILMKRIDQAKKLVPRFNQP